MLATTDGLATRLSTLTTNIHEQLTKVSSTFRNYFNAHDLEFLASDLKSRLTEHADAILSATSIDDRPRSASLEVGNISRSPASS